MIDYTGLSASLTHIVSCLHEADHGLTPGTVCLLTGIPNSQVAHLLPRLELAGLFTAHAQPDNAPATYSLTPLDSIETSGVYHDEQLAMLMHMAVESITTPDDEPHTNLIIVVRDLLARLRDVEAAQ